MYLFTAMKLEPLGEVGECLLLGELDRRVIRVASACKTVDSLGAEGGVVGLSGLFESSLDVGSQLGSVNIISLCSSNDQRVLDSLGILHSDERGMSPSQSVDEISGSQSSDKLSSVAVSNSSHKRGLEVVPNVLCDFLGEGDSGFKCVSGEPIVHKGKALRRVECDWVVVEEIGNDNKEALLGKLIGQEQGALVFETQNVGQQ